MIDQVIISEMAFLTKKVYAAFRGWCTNSCFGVNVIMMVMPT